MSVSARIGDGLGTLREAKVTPGNALLVQVLPETSAGIPPADLSNLRLLTEFFVNAALSSNQRVDGSVTPVEFAVSAAASATKWITRVRVIIEAEQFEIATADFRRYGAAAAGLVNGMQFEAVQSGITTSIAAEPILIAGDWLNYTTSFVNFVNVITAQADYLQLTFDFAKPVVLTPGSTDRLILRVRDNLVTALVAAVVTPRQYAIATGYQETT